MAAVCILFCLARTTDAKAEDGTEENKIYNLNITVERNYDYAKEVLELVNQEREKAGVGTVQMDEELTEAAMVRAMETTVAYSHGRTNGLPMRTLVSVVAMENIGCARNTPEIIMDAWMSSEGHRYNILYSNWNSVGIGCIKYKDTYFWVQLFSRKEPTGTVKSGQETSEESIEVSSEFLDLLAPNVTDNPVEETITIELSQPCIGWEYFYFEPNASSFTFESSNPGIATIDASGTITVLKNGSTTITAYYAGTSDVAYSQKVTCSLDNGSSKNTSSQNTVTSPSSSYKVDYYCDVIFRKKNGQRPVIKQVKKNTTVKKIKDPKRKGYVFKGWYTSKGKKFNFSKKITSRTVLYAKWKKK